MSAGVQRVQIKQNVGPVDTRNFVNSMNCIGISTCAPRCRVNQSIYLAQIKNNKLFCLVFYNLLLFFLSHNNIL